MQILVPALILGILGLLFGAGLAVSAKAFAVEHDEKADAIREMLPGANCGGCGFTGCDAYAKALAAGKTNGGLDISLCPVGGQALVDSLAEFLGVERKKLIPRVARVLCQGNEGHCAEVFEYRGLPDCISATQVLGGPKACAYSCLGLGSCVKVCEFGAIKIENDIAVIDPTKCTACGRCAATCPKSVIELRPKSDPVTVRCHTPERGKEVRKNCSIGCIACGRCVRACEYDAIHMVGNLPRVEYTKCTACLHCVQACPTHTITAEGVVEGKNSAER